MIDHEVRPARSVELAAVGALTADGLRTRGGGTDHDEAELLDAGGRAAAASPAPWSGTARPGARRLGLVDLVLSSLPDMAAAHGRKNRDHMNTAGWTISIIAIAIVVVLALREWRHRR